MDKSAQPPAGMEESTMKLPAEVRRKKMNIAKLTRLARPQKFVRFGAPEHVEFGGAFIDGGANRQRHQHQTDAVLLIPIVEPVLIEVKGIVIKKAVHDSGRRAVDTQDEHAQPAALEKPPGRVLVKGAQRRGAECGAARVEAAPVVLRQTFERLTALGLAGDLLEADVKVLLEAAKPPANIGAM